MCTCIYQPNFNVVAQRIQLVKYKVCRAVSTSASPSTKFKNFKQDLGKPTATVISSASVYVNNIIL